MNRRLLPRRTSSNSSIGFNASEHATMHGIGTRRRARSACLFRMLSSVVDRVSSAFATRPIAETRSESIHDRVPSVNDTQPNSSQDITLPPDSLPLPPPATIAAPAPLLAQAQQPETSTHVSSNGRHDTSLLPPGFHHNPSSTEIVMSSSRETTSPPALVNETSHPGSSLDLAAFRVIPLRRVPLPTSRRRAPLQRHGAFHEHIRPYWNTGSGHEPPVVYGRDPATLPENQTWHESWGPLPHLSHITPLIEGPPTPQQVIDYLNDRFRHNRAAYHMALDLLFPQPQEPHDPRGVPVFTRILPTAQWRGQHPDWEGGIVPVNSTWGPPRADDAANSVVSSDSEDAEGSADAKSMFTNEEQRAILDRVAGALTAIHASTSDSSRSSVVEAAAVASTSAVQLPRAGPSRYVDRGVQTERTSRKRSREDDNGASASNSSSAAASSSPIPESPRIRRRLNGPAHPFPHISGTGASFRAVDLRRATPLPLIPHCRHAPRDSPPPIPSRSPSASSGRSLSRAGTPRPQSAPASSSDAVTSYAHLQRSPSRSPIPNLPSRAQSRASSASSSSPLPVTRCRKRSRDGSESEAQAGSGGKEKGDGSPKRARRD